MPVLLVAVGVVVERSTPLSARPGQPRPAAGRGQVEVMTRTTVEVMTRRGLEVGSHYRPAGTSAVVAGHAMVPVGRPRNARSRRALGPDGCWFRGSRRPPVQRTRPRHGSRWAPRRGSLRPASRCRHRPAPGHPRAPGTLPRRGGRVTNGGGLPFELHVAARMYVEQITALWRSTCTATHSPSSVTTSPGNMVRDSRYPKSRPQREKS